ncbi:AMP-binding protein [Nonomuraea sp. NPDC047897]|uniref:AMP-binding protein n=1 Tax=Nonomuraea sp. NPDC047897 TaxID=3364346 RepID=UPI00371AB844
MSSPVSLAGILARRAARHPAAPAFTVDGVGTLDYLTWHRESGRVAAGLAARGLRPGERVLLAFEDGDWLAFASCLLGVLAAGGVAVPVRAPVPPSHLLATGAAVTSVGLVAGGPVTGEGPPVPGFDGWQARAGELTAAPSAPPGPAPTPPAPTPPAPTPPAPTPLLTPEPVTEPRSGADPAVVILTSGTTGTAKAVLSTHASLTEDWPGGDDVPPPQVNALLTSVAIGTNAALSVLKGCLVNGVHVVLTQPFAAERLAALIDEHRVTALSLVPTTARLAVAALRRQGCAPGRVRSVVSSSAPLDQPTVAGLAAVFPAAEIFNVYTVAEGGAGLQHRCSPDRPPALGTLGPEARLVDAAGRDVGPGETGELWLRHTGPALGYLTPLPAGAAGGSGTRYLADGWIATGDLCRRDADGLVHFVERADDVVVSGGLNIASATVEAALRTHGAVAEVAVFGVPHAVLGRVAVAAVVLSPSTAPASTAPASTAPASTAPASAVSPAELRDHCAALLPRDHVPADVVIVAELPLTPNGKVRKRLLADRYAGTHRPDAHRPDAHRPDGRHADPPTGTGADPLGATGVTTPRAAAGHDGRARAVEETVLAAFREVLGVEQVGPDDNFLRLGGHSLLAVQLAGELERRLGRPVPSAWILRFPRAGDLSDALTGTRAEAR